MDRKCRHGVRLRRGGDPAMSVLLWGFNRIAAVRPQAAAQ